MTNEQGLVERLRRAAVLQKALGRSDYATPAADALEAQSAQIAELRAEQEYERNNPDAGLWRFWKDKAVAYCERATAAETALATAREDAGFVSVGREWRCRTRPSIRQDWGPWLGWRNDVPKPGNTPNPFIEVDEREIFALKTKEHSHE